MPSLVDPAARVVASCPFFEWWEFSGWEHADAVRVARAQSLVMDVLCPARRVLGPVRVSRGGWYFSTFGGPREGVHDSGAAADVVPEAVPVGELYAWLRDRTLYGEVIHERDHVHVTLPGFGGNMQALIEVREGVFRADPEAAPLSNAALAGLHSSGPALLIAGAAVGLWRARRRA